MFALSAIHSLPASRSLRTAAAVSRSSRTNTTFRDDAIRGCCSRFAIAASSFRTCKSRASRPALCCPGRVRLSPRAGDATVLSSGFTLRACQSLRTGCRRAPPRTPKRRTGGRRTGKSCKGYRTPCCCKTTARGYRMLVCCKTMANLTAIAGRV